MEPPANPGEGPAELEFTVENVESVSCDTLGRLTC